MAEPLLLVCYTFPPYTGIGGRRWAKFARELAHRGHYVHVVHARLGKSLEGSLWTMDVQHPNIVRHTISARYPTVLLKRPLVHWHEKMAYRFWLSVLPLLTQGNIHDRSVLWGTALLHTTRKLIKAHGIRTVIATGPPFAALHHLLPLADEGVRLIADLRDPWTWGPLYGRANSKPRRLRAEEKMEREVVNGYSAVLAPSEAMLDHLRAAYPARKACFHLLSHVIDETELNAGEELPKDGTFRLFYAGSVYDKVGFMNYFGQVVKAFAHVRSVDPERWQHLRFDLYITGHGTVEMEDLVRAAGQQQRIHFHAPLTGAQLFPIARRADLVPIYLPPEKKHFISTKINELAYLQKPILHVGEPGRLSEHVLKHALGASVPVEQIQTQMQKVLLGQRSVLNAAMTSSGAHELSHVTDRLLQIIGR
jgi:glycosyltransferase involved in cell wall biosynthesis